MNNKSIINGMKIVFVLRKKSNTVFRYFLFIYKNLLKGIKAIIFKALGLCRGIHVYTWQYKKIIRGEY